MHGSQHHGEDDHVSEDDINQSCQDGTCDCKFKSNSDCSAVFGDHGSHDGEDREKADRAEEDPSDIVDMVADVIPLPVIISEIEVLVKAKEANLAQKMSSGGDDRGNGSQERCGHPVAGVVLHHTKKQSTEETNTRPETMVYIDPGYKGGPRYCMKVNAAREQQFAEEQQEVDDADPNFLADCDPRCADVGYETPTEEDYDHSDLPKVKVGTREITDFRVGEGRKKKLGKNMPRYKHALRAAHGQQEIPLPEVFKKVYDNAAFIGPDSENDDTSSEASDVSYEVMAL